MACTEGSLWIGHYETGAIRDHEVSHLHIIPAPTLQANSRQIAATDH